MPEIAIQSPARAPVCSMPLYVVMPAQMIGAAACGVAPSEYARRSRDRRECTRRSRRYACSRQIAPPDKPTRRVEPRHADPIAFLHVLNILADRDGDPDTFVTRNERQRGFERPIAARFDLDENLIASGFLNASTTAACTVFCMCEPFLHSCEPLTRQRRQGRGRLRSSSRVRPTRRRRPSRNSDCRTADSRRPRSLCPGRV